jgi:acyl CoA:acetate/3-ketoacid CoA transferase
MLGQYVKIGHDCFFLCASGFIIILSFETIQFFLKYVARCMLYTQKELNFYKHGSLDASYLSVAHFSLEGSSSLAIPSTGKCVFMNH